MLNLHNVICQLNLSKAGEKRYEAEEMRLEGDKRPDNIWPFRKSLLFSPH